MWVDADGRADARFHAIGSDAAGVAAGIVYDALRDFADAWGGIRKQQPLSVDSPPSSLYLSFEIQEATVSEQSSMLHVRMDTDLKQKASQALASMGLSASEAVRLLFHRIVADQAFPLELKVPNAETQAAMDEADRLLKGEESPFATADEAFAALDEAAR